MYHNSYEYEYKYQCEYDDYSKSKDNMKEILDGWSNKKDGCLPCLAINK